jgi:hypothetical protein
VRTKQASATIEEVSNFFIMADFAAFLNFPRGNLYRMAVAF